MFDIKHLLYLVPLTRFAFADLDLDRDDVPPPCRAICQPIVDLTNRCNVDLPGRDNDRQEDLLERQCVCTNGSFDVQRIAGLCASCFQQNLRAPDDRSDDRNKEWDDDEIREIMRDCGFSSVSYSSQLSTAAQTVNVVATAPTATSQLTTTIDRNSNSNNNDNNNKPPQPTETNRGPGGGDDDRSSQTTGGSRADQTSANTNGPVATDLAVPGAAPLGGFSAALVLGAFGVVAAGGALLL